MKRDMELVRSILLKVEELHEPSMDDLLELDAEISGDEANLTGDQEREKLEYHLTMLIQEAGLLRGTGFGSMQGTSYADLQLTWNGHEFLNAIRDQTVWDKTKAGATKVGNWSIGFLMDAAKAYAKLKAKEVLGIDL